MEIKKTTTISGYVAGTLWSEDRGYTRSKEYKGDNLTAVLAEVEADFNGGKLTVRHDLSKQTGARLTVTTISTVVIDGDVFKNEKTNTVTFGDWSEDDESFMELFFTLISLFSPNLSILQHGNERHSKRDNELSKYV